MNPTQEKLKELYKKLYELTNPDCRSCRAPLSCCSPEYCELTKELAKEHWDVTLVPITGTKIPFLGEKGCIVDPHLRPLCTRHSCVINSLGVYPGDKEKTQKYFELLEEIEVLELEFFT